METAIIVALIAALPGIITAIGALRHSQNTRQTLSQHRQLRPADAAWSRHWHAPPPADRQAKVNGG